MRASISRIENLWYQFGERLFAHEIWKQEQSSSTTNWEGGVHKGIGNESEGRIQFSLLLRPPCLLDSFWEVEEAYVLVWLWQNLRSPEGFTGPACLFPEGRKKA